MKQRRFWQKRGGALAGAMLMTAVIFGSGMTVRAEGTTVTGTVAAGSSQTLLYINTSGGQMQVKLDPNTDFSKCRAIMQGTELSLSVYRGSDAYWHASSVASAGAVQTVTGQATTASTSGATAPNGQTLTNVYGTVQNGTKTGLLKLSTSGGNMEIKIDSSTDGSGARFLAPGSKVMVAIYRGSDAYQHAAKITADGVNAATSAKVNQSGTIKVSGTVAGDSTANVLKLNTSGGQMHLVMDGSTSIGTRVLMPGQQITATLGYGSDQYWHVLSTSGSIEADATANSSSLEGQSYVQINGQKMQVVHGTAAGGSGRDLMKLNTPDGQMEIKIDPGTQVSEARLLAVGKTYYVAIYYNSGYWHAGRISAADATESKASIGQGSLTVKGTVASATTFDKLYLATSGGMMEIRMDKSGSYAGLLIPGDEVTATLGYGSDHLWHVVSITR